MPAAKPPKLNLFALPSQTSLLFFIIAVVLGIPLMLSASSASFLLLPVLPVGVALLTVWDFLRRPDLEQRRWKMAQLPAEHTWLRDQVDRLAQECGLNRPPQLLVAHEQLSTPFAFGTWRRRYLVFPDWLLPQMEQAAHRYHAENPAALDAVLRHELAHFANQDVWLASLARSLLKMTVIFLAANWFAMLWLPFTYELLRQAVADWAALFPAPFLALFPPEIRQFVGNPPALARTDAFVMEVMIAGALWPLIIGALLLWRTTWNALLQVREQMADARVASWLHSAAAIGRATKWFVGAQLSARAGEDTGATENRLATMLHNVPGLRRLAPPLAWPGAIGAGHWLSPQPNDRTRHRTLAQPEQVYGTAAAVGRRAGLAVLLLYLLMASIFAPSGQGINSEIAAGFGFILIALGLTPLAIVDGGSRSRLARQVAKAVGIYSLLFGLAVMGVMAVAALVLAWQPRSLDVIMYAIAMVAPRGAIAVVVDDPTVWLVQAVVGAFVTFAVGLPILMTLFVVADLALKRQVLTWYRALLVQRYPTLFFMGVTLVGALVLWLGAVPLLNLIAFPTIFETDGAFWVRIGLAVLLVVLTTALVLTMHVRYARRCPRCPDRIAGAYTLGRCCPQCGCALNTWLVASY